MGLMDMFADGSVDYVLVVVWLRLQSLLCRKQSRHVALSYIPLIFTHYPPSLISS
jgi:hypothetical protein